MTLSPSQAQGPTPEDDRLARYAAMISLVVSIVMLGGKFWAFQLTQSQAVFSDAMETIVNVVTGGLALMVLAVAHKPADRQHPYGHGKVEFFSAAFEGGLIAFASLMICAEAIHALATGLRVERIGFGLVITVVAALGNAVLGFYLLRAGRKHLSPALEASGQHVLSDVWTSAAVVVGLLLVQVTGIDWLDPLVALIVGLGLGLTGIKLVRRSMGGLLDEEDTGILTGLVDILNRLLPESEIIHLHHVRVMRNGRYHHIDAHAVIPEFWNVTEAHDQTKSFEQEVMKIYPNPGEMSLHVDPCRAAYCRICSLSECPIRRHPFVDTPKLTLEELINPEEPTEFYLSRNQSDDSSDSAR